MPIHKSRPAVPPANIVAKIPVHEKGGLNIKPKRQPTLKPLILTILGKDLLEI